MCSEFEIHVKELFRLLEQLDILPALAEEKNSYHVFPGLPAPVIYQEDNQKRLELFQYGLIPSWSKEKKLKFSTHNARVETITDKPTWKAPFLRKHCIVPISNFREPVREGKFAGHMLSYQAPDDQPLYALGIYDIWNREDHLINSFAIITAPPSAYMEDSGHHREPVFVTEKDLLAWLDTKEQTASDLLSFIKKHKKSPEYKISKVRRLKSA